MDNLRCVAVDDEPLALQNLESYIRKTPGLTLIRTFLNPVQAHDFLSSDPADLVFLDIQMPDLNGIQLSRLIGAQTRLIFTTAYSEYALDGLKAGAVDYLLKPFGYDEFLAAVAKVRSFVSAGKLQSGGLQDLWFVKSEGRLVPVLLSAILYLEAGDDYVHFILDSGKKLLVHGTLKDLETRLPAGMFFRIHRSWLINLSKITAIDRSRVFFGNQYLVVGEAYRDAFADLLKSRSL